MANCEECNDTGMRTGMAAFGNESFETTMSCDCEAVTEEITALYAATPDQASTEGGR